MTDLVEHIYDEYYRLHPYERQRSQWVMNQATIDHLERLLKPPPDPDDDPDDADGIHLERTPESWRCVAKGTVGWHEPDCPHVDWSRATATEKQIGRIAPD
jgi:hypothetical protein